MKSKLDTSKQRGGVKKEFDTGGVWGRLHAHGKANLSLGEYRAVADDVINHMGAILAEQSSVEHRSLSWSSNS